MPARRLFHSLGRDVGRWPREGMGDGDLRTELEILGVMGCGRTHLPLTDGALRQGLV